MISLAALAVSDPLLLGLTLCFQAIELDAASGELSLGPIASGVVAR